MFMPGERKTFYDWKIYNKQLVERGKKLANEIKTVKKEVVDYWKEELNQMNEGKEGRRFRYTDSMIVFLAILKSAFNVDSYRKLQGLAYLFFENVPEYSRINRRMRALELNDLKKINREITKEKTKGRVLEIAMDGTGVQINGKYVWYDKKHNKGKMRKRDWRKLNIVIDTETRQILGIRVLGRDENEGSHENTAGIMVDVFENIDKSSKITKVRGDGGYDNEDNFDMFEFLGIEPVIRIRKPSRNKAEQMSRSLKTKKRRKFFEKKRNKEALKQFDWENYVEDSRYGKRSGIEGFIGSFKRFFGEKCFSRLDEAIEREIITKALVWNVMM